MDEEIFYANPMLCEISGYSLNELARIPLTQLFVPEDLPVVEAILQRRRGGETGSIAWSCRVLCKDGGILKLSIESKVIDLVGGKATLGVVQDVTQRERDQAALETMNERLRVLSRSLLDVHEAERRTISHELHDDVGQSLLALKLGLHRLEKRLDPADTGLLAQCIEVTDSVQERVRELSVELLPPHLEQLGLHDALRWLVSRQRELTGLAIVCRFGPDFGRVPPEVEIACFRICQEALSNATRHAKARSIFVELDTESDSFVLTVCDDGVGFEEHAKRERGIKPGSLGLISMEERARLAGGRMELRTAPGRGTTLRASFPLVERVGRMQPSALPSASP